jgi:hypothetical protein
MAHDNQLARSSNESSEHRETSKGYSGIVADWLTIFAEIYREEITEGTAMLYREALKDIKPEILHKAFLRVTKTYKFRPMPADVLEAANIEMENAAPRRTNFPTITQEERNAALADTAESRERLRKSLHEKAVAPSALAEILARDYEIFTPEQWAETEKAYREYLTTEGNKDAYNRAHGISPIPRSREEQLAIYYNLPKIEREKIRKQVRP